MHHHRSSTISPRSMACHVQLIVRRIAVGRLSAGCRSCPSMPIGTRWRWLALFALGLAPVAGRSAGHRPLQECQRHLRAPSRGRGPGLHRRGCAGPAVRGRHRRPVRRRGIYDPSAAHRRRRCSQVTERLRAAISRIAIPGGGPVMRYTRRWSGSGGKSPPGRKRSKLSLPPTALSSGQ